MIKSIAQIVYILGNMQRKIDALQFDSRTGFYMQFLILEKKIITISAEDQTNKCICKRICNDFAKWIYIQKFDFYCANYSQMECKYDHALWEAVGLKKNNLRLKISADLNCVYDFFHSSRFNQIKQLSSYLKNIHSIIFSDTRFPEKNTMKQFIEYIIKLVVLRKLQETIAFKKFKSKLPFTIPKSLVNIIFEYYQ